jgi:hypothetical protein
MKAEIGELRAVVAGVVGKQIETDEDVRSLHARIDGGVRPDDVAGLVTLKEATATGVAGETLRRWASTGLIASKRVGLRWFVDLDSVRAHLRTRCGIVESSTRKNMAQSRA